FHALRTRVAGSRRFVALHVLVPGRWTVQAGHDLCERLEEEIAIALPRNSWLSTKRPKEGSSRPGGPWPTLGTKGWRRQSRCSWAR
ncbi:MAG: cation transporter dimerization domain-containing protein, partial [Cyanobium sp.]